MNDGIRMQLSAFVDGELPQNEAEMLLRRMSQDAKLRREVAEYMAIGRLMRAEAGLAGADRLHERVSAELDDRPADTGVLKVADGASRALRPLAGAAIAATVALIGIFALQQPAAIDELPGNASTPVVNEAVPKIDAQVERQRQYFVNHAETSSQLGANGMNSRVVSLRFSEESFDVTDQDESVSPADLDDSYVDDEETTTRPQ